MPRQPWTPTTDEQRAVIAKLDQLAAAAAGLWDTVELAAKLGVPKDVIARHAKPAASRATIHRRLGGSEQESDSQT